MNFHDIKYCRAQGVIDDALESVGIDIIPDHKNDCPYQKAPRDQKVICKIEEV